jgi:hypothetical protein
LASVDGGLGSLPTKDGDYLKPSMKGQVLFLADWEAKAGLDGIEP